MRRLEQAIYTYKAFREENTDELAKHLSLLLIPGSIIALDGDLGAGKTRFSQGFAKAIGVEDVVNSPTFTIIKEYEGTKLPLYHMDVYRITLEEADELGLDEYFYGEGVTLVEWSSKIEALLPPQRLSIYIENQAGQERLFHLTPYGEPYRSWCRVMKENGNLQ
ncbi:tRNA (adenosine(37)-N6)-threonylcarbamoyltransferase complex ATPase subunit type 1 TsaE [Paenibacillus eucommiae]|uniref:tRNA threonylcarbamoyladenosine biosynthesis protein TsaE n=1 Tax=Paenibacillus eucommiae TaxID=1355755 RepID=A0ABS4J576_9BACL|nr:tRNA (adenosine(37)-N6)-threonylcarbamoyltransferase complex ATPase subunit type 1 TsaE [Paenibacillus eucommiae]MBP1995001.1 tRNA threonylcarbamoyladenosine biosynthesis protein TsaE [Paenibacillus eucommiae]